MIDTILGYITIAIALYSNYAVINKDTNGWLIKIFGGFVYMIIYIRMYQGDAKNDSLIQKKKRIKFLMFSGFLYVLQYIYGYFTWKH